MENFKYRKKPIVVDAKQWFPKNDGGHGYINTLEGKMKVSPGDWIITGVNGERYPCKPDIFEKTYDAVNGDEKPDVETKIKYFKEVTMLIRNLVYTGNPYVRKDYHEDGSMSSYYGFEIDSQQFRRLISEHDGG